MTCPPTLSERPQLELEGFPPAVKSPVAVTERAGLFALSFFVMKLPVAPLTMLLDSLSLTRTFRRKQAASRLAFVPSKLVCSPASLPSLLRFHLYVSVYHLAYPGRILSTPKILSRKRSQALGPCRTRRQTVNRLAFVPSKPVCSPAPAFSLEV